MDPVDRQTGALLRETRRRAGLTLRSAAANAGTSHSALAAYEAGRKSPSVSTLFRIFDAYGFTAGIDLAPRIRSRNGIPRGEELEDVLALAEMFPARVERVMASPRFGKK